MNKLVVITEDKVILRGLPRPVSVNRYVGKRHAGKEKSRHKKEFWYWVCDAGLKKRNDVQKFLFGNNLENFQKKEELSSIKVSYYWGRNLITKKNTLRVIDASNHIKATEDSIAQWLNIDDCYFHESGISMFHCAGLESFHAIIHMPKPLNTDACQSLNLS